MKFIAGLFGGLLFAILGASLITITFAASSGKGGTLGAGAFFLFLLLGFLIAFKAPTAAKAWRRLLLSSAVFSFLAPISAIVYTGSFMATNIDASSKHAGAQAAGAAIDGGLLSGAMGFVGFFLGITFLVVGLLVGRDKQVVYVEKLPKEVKSL